ncbi:MAG: hypothetical protein JXA67_03875, partial [Micromonosporaceae bacterium]|nr:hypothetical protein [Micromonosporaceae bacterium]
TAGRTEATGGLDPSTEAPFHDLIVQELAGHGHQVAAEQAGPLRAATIDVVYLVRADVRLVGFWDNAHKREQLRRKIIHRLDETRLEDGSDLFQYQWLSSLADRIMELAKANRAKLAAVP